MEIRVLWLEIYSSNEVLTSHFFYWNFEPDNSSERTYKHKLPYNSYNFNLLFYCLSIISCVGGWSMRGFSFCFSTWVWCHLEDLSFVTFNTHLKYFKINFILSYTLYNKSKISYQDIPSLFEKVSRTTPLMECKTNK